MYDTNTNLSNSSNKLDAFESELSKLVGLHDLKLQLRKLAKGMLMDQRRRATGKTIGPRKKPHMAFLGKTVVAGLIGKLLHSVGLLTTENVVEVQRTDLVGKYIGQTGPMTRSKINEAMWGGVLFVDEAYSLAFVDMIRDFGKKR